MNRSIRSLTACLLAVSLAIGAAPAHSESLATAYALGTDRERIVSFLARPEAEAQLRTHGVDAADAQARVAALTDEEAAQLAARIDELPAGEEYPLNGLPPEIQLGVLAVTLVILAVVLLIRHIAKSLA